MKLYGYNLSLASFRVRIAFALKGIDREDAFLDLLKGDQFEPEFQKLNPQMVVPALITDEAQVIGQSMAILEYLDETYPEPPLLPGDAGGRARVRQLAQIAIADCHPLVVPRIRKYLTETLGHSEDELLAWIRHWMGLANDAIEAILSDGNAGKYAHGDRVTLADLCLIPQVAGSQRFNCDMSGAPRLMKLFETCMAEDAFMAAHAKNQPDFQAS
jgi:maleylacetoacetate isomerase